MSVSILVVYTGEEKIRNWLQTKVKERQLYIRNDSGELKAGMKTVDIQILSSPKRFSRWGSNESRLFSRSMFVDRRRS